ncbi:hypothetical protein ACFSVJ_21820 [Prauserella oleivorans]
MITAIAAVVFVSCLLCRAFRQRRRSDATSTGRHRPAKLPRVGRHWREPDQNPSPVLVHALKTVGTHTAWVSFEKAKPHEVAYIKASHKPGTSQAVPSIA